MEVSMAIIVHSTMIYCW